MFKKSNIFLIVLGVVLSLSLISCSSTKGLEVTNSNQTLDNSKWELISLNQKEIKKVEKVANINFEKDRVFGNLGCNNFFGAYKLNKNSLEIGQVGSTMMMCQNMQTEQDFAKVLQDVKTYKIDKNSLVFFDENSKEIAKFRN